jgi:hypothetical protein
LQLVLRCHIVALSVCVFFCILIHAHFLIGLCAVKFARKWTRIEFNWIIIVINRTDSVTGPPDLVVPDRDSNQVLPEQYTRVQYSETCYQMMDTCAHEAVHVHRLAAWNYWHFRHDQAEVDEGRSTIVPLHICWLTNRDSSFLKETWSIKMQRELFIARSFVSSVLWLKFLFLVRQ